MAQKHTSFLQAGVRLFGVSVDSPAQHSAMIEKLSLPFPLISDPDRNGIISPLGLADDKDPRQIARPALVLFAPGGDEVWRFVSRDFADRLAEDEVLDTVATRGWPSVDQAAPELGEAAAGSRAMPLEALPGYFRGARFAALAMGLRHGHIDEAIKTDSKAFVAEMDRFTEAVRDLRDPDD